MATRAAMGIQSALVLCSPKAMATVIANATGPQDRERDHLLSQRHRFDGIRDQVLGGRSSGESSGVVV